MIALILALFGIKTSIDFEDKKEDEPYYQLRSDWVSAGQAEQ
ncbi:hypothetical protein [Pseudomonas japonica]|nr:hypothetical protein [Pseudomonas japonica]